MDSVLFARDSVVQGSLGKGWVPRMRTTKLNPAVFICAVAAPKGSQEPEPLCGRHQHLPEDKKNPLPLDEADEGQNAVVGTSGG